MRRKMFALLSLTAALCFVLWIAPDGPDDVLVSDTVDSHTLLLEISDVARVGGQLHRDELIGPYMVVGVPHLAECAATDSLVQHLLPNALVRANS